MNIHALKLAYFSPTGTTKSIIQNIACGIDALPAELFDITPPENRAQQFSVSATDLLLIAVPVYGGRVPPLLDEWLQRLKADNTPAVCVVVYGNRAYEDALLELKQAVQKAGCVPVACAAFIGEHSFSSEEIPVAVGRPETSDLRQAELLGCKIMKKIQSASSVAELSDVHVPGNVPYKARGDKLVVDFIAVDAHTCKQCGVCAKACPVGAIDPVDYSVDTEKCILCCACIKSCPENARSMKDGPVKDMAMGLNKKCQERKEPEYFF